jgi:hypothetical protein
MKKFVYISLLTVIIFSLFGGIVHAQNIPADPTEADITALTDYASGVNAGDIDIIINPESPSAYEDVSIKLDSNTVDLNRYLIQWVVDGDVKKSGLGLRNFNITTGDYGSTIKISARISLGFNVVQKDILLAPQDATVLWEAIDSSVPPFYRGKKFPGRESLIKISAIPNFQLGSDSMNLGNAVFLWDRNNSKILGAGGFGKDSIIIKHNRLRDSESITAHISDVSDTVQTSKTITFPVTEPELHWYTRDTYNYRRLQSVDNGVRITGGDVNLVAEPFFFSQNDSTNLIYDWSMNNARLYLNPDSPQNEILVNNPGKLGQTNFSIKITNPITFLQEATKVVSLYFQGAQQ